MRELAELAGVSVMTVSRALRNNQKISKATRDRIAQLAEEHGYKVNPLVAAQMTNIRARHIVKYKATLGLLIHEPPEGFWQGTKSVIDGAIETCKEMGFGCDIFDLSDSALTPHRLDQVLKSRGIQGLIECPMRMDLSKFDIDFSRLIYVSSNPGFLPQTFHRVCSDHYGNMDMLLRLLTQSGFKRPGLIIARDLDNRTNHLWTSRFLAYQLTEDLVKIPLFMPADRMSYDSSLFKQWLKDFEPDVLISSSQEVYESGFYTKAGLQIPENMEMVKININTPKLRFSGIDSRSREVGASCVRLMAQLMYQNEYGFPENPISILIPGHWRIGTMCPSVKQIPA
jgi:LacI family transcriptional regulator